ncbi:MAG TPA: TRAM domain-containing protein, partial [Pirellulales bacterium]
LLELQTAISLELNEEFIGRTVEALVEGPSKHGKKQQTEDGSGVFQLEGRTTCDRIVVFDGTARQVGRMQSVEIYDATPNTLQGMVSTRHIGPEVFQLGGMGSGPKRPAPV